MPHTVVVERWNVWALEKEAVPMGACDPLSPPTVSLPDPSETLTELAYNHDGGQRVQLVWQRHSNWQQQDTCAQRGQPRQAVCP